MQKINYFEIIKKAWAITWHNKYLWWFGFFISLTGTGGFFNLNLNNSGKFQGQEISPEVWRQVSGFFADNARWIAIGAAIFFIIFIVLAVFGIIAQGGLIKSIGKIIKGEAVNFREGFKEGKKYFWRILAIGLAIGIFMAVIFTVLFVPIAFLFYAKSYVLAGILTFGAVIILVPIFILAYFSRIFACIYAVLGDLSFWPAIENAYFLFRKKFWPSIVMSLVFFLAGILFGIIILVALIPIVVAFAFMGLALFLVLQKVGVAIAVALGLLVLLAAILFLQSVFQTFRQAAWVLFFKEIATPEVPEKIVEAETEKAEAVPTPDVA